MNATLNAHEARPLVVVPGGGRKLAGPAPTGRLYIGSYHLACRRARRLAHATTPLAGAGGQLAVLTRIARRAPACRLYCG